MPDFTVLCMGRCRIFHSIVYHAFECKLQPLIFQSKSATYHFMSIAGDYITINLLETVTLF